MLRRLPLPALRVTLFLLVTSLWLASAAVRAGDTIITWQDGPTLAFPGGQPNVWFGRALATADLNADGIIDLVTSAPAADIGEQTAAGQILIALGPDLQSVSTLVDPEPVARSYLGMALHIADLNADGHPDIIAGAPGVSPLLADRLRPSVPGKVLTFYGPDFVTVHTLQPSTEFDGIGFGGSLTSGDLTGDGLLDLVVGDTNPFFLDTEFNRLPPASYPRDGVRIYAGPNLELVRQLSSGSESVLGICSPYECSRFGASVATGDVDGDGLTDLLVGETHSIDTFAADGSVYVFRAPDLQLSTRVMAMPSFSPFSGLGASIAITDLDRDGTADLVAGHPTVVRPSPRGTPTGEVLAVANILGPPGESTRWTLTPIVAEPDSRFGERVAAADVDGDGHPDILTTANQPHGHIVIFRGPDFATNQLVEGITNGTLHATDLDADGRADLVVLSEEEHLRILYSRKAE